VGEELAEDAGMRNGDLAVECGERRSVQAA